MQCVDGTAMIPLAALESARQVREQAASAPVVMGLAEQFFEVANELCWEVGLVDGFGHLVDGPDDADGLPRLDHVGIVVADLRETACRYITLLRGVVVAGGDAPTEGIRTVHLRFPGGGKLELMQPISDGAVAKFLERHGPGVHHLTFAGFDVRATVERAAAEGVATIGTELASPFMNQTFLAPRSMSRTAVQIVDKADHYGHVPGICLDDVVEGRWVWSQGRPVPAPHEHHQTARPADG